MERNIYPFNPEPLPRRREIFIQEIEKIPCPSEFKTSVARQGVQVGESIENKKSAGERIPAHVYSPVTNFGHFLPQSNIHPMRYRRIPDFQTTAEDYGRHYLHPEQKYSRVLNLKSPPFESEISRSNQDRFRTEIKRMHD